MQVRGHDQHNHLACEFSNPDVLAEEVVDVGDVLDKSLGRSTVEMSSDGINLVAGVSPGARSLPIAGNSLGSHGSNP